MTSCQSVISTVRDNKAGLGVESERTKVCISDHTVRPLREGDAFEQSPKVRE